VAGESLLDAWLLQPAVQKQLTAAAKSADNAPLTDGICSRLVELENHLKKYTAAASNNGVSSHFDFCLSLVDSCRSDVDCVHYTASLCNSTCYNDGILITDVVHI